MTRLLGYEHPAPGRLGEELASIGTRRFHNILDRRAER